MTDLLDELHADAAPALLRNNATIAGAVLTEVPEATAWPDPPYFMIYTIVAWPEDGDANGLDHQAVTCKTTWYVHCVGETAAAARGLGMQARATLLNARPTIAGRNCCMIVQDDASAPPQKDEQTGTPRWDLPVVYSLTTVPG